LKMALQKSENCCTESLPAVPFPTCKLLTTLPHEKSPQNNRIPFQSLGAFQFVACVINFWNFSLDIFVFSLILYMGLYFIHS
jgi:hypothetical protein